MSEISVLAVEIIHLDEPLTVYDLSIDHDESFLLANGVIAHNSTICLGRNGLRYTLPDHEPINHDIPYLSGPPYHPHCRSVMVKPYVRGGRSCRRARQPGSGVRGQRCRMRCWGRHGRGCLELVRLRHHANCSTQRQGGHLR